VRAKTPCNAPVRGVFSVCVPDITGVRAAAFACVIGLSGATSLVSVPVRAAEPTTIDQAIAIAVSTHPVVRGAEATRRAAAEDVVDARADFLPSVDVSGESGWEHTDDPTTRARASAVSGAKSDGVNQWRNLGSVTVRQNLFNGFRTPNETEAARRRVTAADHTIRDREEAIALRSAEAYMDVVRSRTIVGLAERNVTAHVEVRDDVKLRLDAGNGDAADLNQAESRLALARSRLTELRGALRVAESDYHEAVGTMPDTLEMPARPVDALPASVEEAVPTALDNNPALLTARSEADASQFDKRAARSPLMPTVDLEFRGTGGDNLGGVRGSDVNGQALVVLRYNLYRGGRDIARSRRAVAVESRALQSQAELARLVEEQIRVDHADMVTARDTVPLLRDRAAAAAQVVSAYRQQFELGRRSLLDVLDVENELFQARISVVNAEIQHRIAEYRVLATMGTLISALGVETAMVPTDDTADG